jgi:hypothetical protein
MSTGRLMLKTLYWCGENVVYKALFRGDRGLVNLAMHGKKGSVKEMAKQLTFIEQGPRRPFKKNVSEYNVVRLWAGSC